MVFLGTYYGYATYNHYKDQNIINGFQILKKDPIHNDLIRHAREKQFDVVYTSYGAHKLQFLSGGNPNFVEFFSNPYRGWKRRTKTRDYVNFSVLVPEGKNQPIYEAHLKKNKISCNRERLKEYLILSQCQSRSQAFSGGCQAGC